MEKQTVKHTPGPWVAGASFKNCYQRIEGSYCENIGNVCVKNRVNGVIGSKERLQCTWECTKEGEANVHLIKSAPDLLKACKVARRFCVRANSDVLAILDKAIAKAEGNH